MIKLLHNVLPLDFCKQTSNDVMYYIFQQPIQYDLERGWCWMLYKPLAIQQMLETVKPKVEEVVGEDLLSTYSYITVYTNNSYMNRHTDRESCEISVSINLASTINWKLYFENTKGVITNVGDGVIYEGSVPHWRDLLVSKKPEFYIQTFLHYVKANGEYAQHENDARPFIPSGTHEN